MQRNLIIILLVVFWGGCTTIKEFSKTSEISQISEKEPLVLRGVAVKNVLLMRIFRAGLYLPVSIDSKNALDLNVPKNLLVLFFLRISSNDFTNYIIDHMKPNLTKLEFQSLENQLKLMRELFPNILPGDTLSLFYQPGEGTSFIHNGQTRGTIQGELFSKAIYSTWIGDKPIDHNIKNQVLGLSNKNLPNKQIRGVVNEQ